MRILFLLPLLLLGGCYDPYYGYTGGVPRYPPTYQPGYYPGNPPPGYGAPGGYNAANCGTPDEPKRCYR
jgi:hypothetical protein